MTICWTGTPRSMAFRLTRFQRDTGTLRTVIVVNLWVPMGSFLLGSFADDLSHPRAGWGWAGGLADVMAELGGGGASAPELVVLEVAEGRGSGEFATDVAHQGCRVTV